VENKMKKIAVPTVLATVPMTAPALAADLNRGYAPAPYSAFSWAGAYLGANIGYQFGSVTNSGGVDPSGFMGGLQVGYNWQTGQFVYGVDGDIQFSGSEDTVGGRKFSNPWFGTVRGRVGYAMNNVLIYGTGGLAYGEGRLETPIGNEEHSHFGWTLGLGAEVSMARNWSVKAEYLFVNLSDERYTLTGLDHDFESSLLRFGFNYRF
jgi:outer membrane immunogenic protein